MKQDERVKDGPRKSYYAVVPANVRYDESLSPNAKLLYGEITCLCNEKGYCWARNCYFAELYGKDSRTISRWIGQLAKRGYIRVEIDKKSGNKRRIYLSTKMPIPMDKNVHTPQDKNVHQNNKDIILHANKISVLSTGLSSAATEAESIQQLMREEVHPKVAAEIVERQKHTPESIGNAIRNAHSRRFWLTITDRFRAKTFRLAGYIVETLNTARREGHEVQLSQRSQAAEQLARDRKAGERPSIGEKETQRIKQEQLRKLRIVK